MLTIDYGGRHCTSYTSRWQAASASSLGFLSFLNFEIIFERYNSSAEAMKISYREATSKGTTLGWHRNDKGTATSYSDFNTSCSLTAILLDTSGETNETTSQPIPVNSQN